MLMVSPYHTYEESELIWLKTKIAYIKKRWVKTYLFCRNTLSDPPTYALFSRRGGRINRRRKCIRILCNCNAYLLHGLLKDWQSTCKDKELISNITQTQSLKKKINKRFLESLGFYKSREHITVCSQYTNPCEYSISTLKGFGLRNEDIMKLSANMKKRNISQSSDESPEFPHTPGELKKLISNPPW